MQNGNDQVHVLLDESARALSRWIVMRHAELDEGLADRYGTGWERAWATDVELRVRLLGQATALDCPDLFVESVRWSGVSNAARDVGPEDLRTSLRATREVLGAELPAESAGRAIAIVESAEALVGTPSALPATAIAATSEHRTLTLRYLEAAMDGRAAEARDLVLDAWRAGLAPTDVYERVLVPAQIEVGRLWHLNEVSIAEEHIVTATTQDIMAHLRAAVPPPAEDAPRMLAAAIGGDLHDVGVRMISDLFLLSGWRALSLGANVPADDVLASVARYEPDVLAISVASPLRLCAVRDLIARLRQTTHGVRTRVMVGGAALSTSPDIWRALGADGTADSAADAVDAARRLVRHSA